jgi:hypothetical protein
VKVHLGALTLTSPSFEHTQPMPDAHSSNGAGVSPELTWTGVPEGTRSFALIVHDPDAPLTNGFTHWVAYGIPADARGLSEGATGGFVAGVHSMGEPGWVPAAPPPGHGDHHYFFHLYALDADLGLPPGLDARQLLERIDDHIIEQARLVGTYRNG